MDASIEPREETEAEVEITTIKIEKVKEEIEKIEIISLKTAILEQVDLNLSVLYVMKMAMKYQC